jgi:hypothetical protein
MNIATFITSCTSWVITILSRPYSSFPLILCILSSHKEQWGHLRLKSCQWFKAARPHNLRLCGYSVALVARGFHGPREQASTESSSCEWITSELRSPADFRIYFVVSFHLYRVKGRAVIRIVNWSNVIHLFLQSWKFKQIIFNSREIKNKFKTLSLQL